MATVDSLDIQIQASAQKANSAIDALVGKLNILATSLGKINGSAITGLANGVNRLSTAMQGMKSVGTADFTRLAKNIEKLGSMNTAGLNTAASSLSHIGRALSGFQAASAASSQIGDIAKNIAKLGNKSVQTAITNIPLLAVAMKDLMQTLSTAPRVSQNLIDMTNALANFAQQGSSVSVVSGTLVSGLNRTSGAMDRTKKSSWSLAAAFGKFYATYFLVIRGIKKLWSSIKSSFDYIEILNYFDAAFGQVAANADLSAFEEMGYESADAYYGSFAKRAEEVTQKMSGFTIGENGLLQSTGAVSLGLDPSKLMNYQAMFGQMSSSMGVASETALKLSQALTEIGADLASVKNLDFESVWNDMASGLTGMSRTLDKYGVNIRNVNLQQKLMELGIDANIQSLNQNDKALLRAIILLENTKYAWGDLANTLNQPANQLRLIKANFQNLSRTIGNLFLPIVKTVLPYINALVIALQRLFAWLGNLIGVDISDISTSIGGADMGDILDQTDELESGLGGAKKAADKLNKSLRQFDELKVINTKQDDGGAGGVGGIGGGLLDAAFEDAFSKYQQEWDKAFAGLENRAQEIADKIEKIFEPIKKIIQDFAIGDFFQAGKDVSNLVKSITSFFTKAIKKVNWRKIGQNIGEFLSGIDWIGILNGIGELIWTALKAALSVWKSAFDAAPVETGIITAVSILKFTKLGGVLTNKINGALSEVSQGLSLQGIATAIAGVFAEFTLVSDAFEGLTSGAQGVGSALGEIVIGAGLAVGALKLIGLSNPWTAVIVGISGVIASFKGVNDAFDATTEKLVNSVAFDGVGTSITIVAQNVSDLINLTGTSSETIQNFSQKFSEIKSSIDEASESIEEYRITLEREGSLSEEEIGGMKGSIDELVNALKKDLKYNTDLAFETFMRLSGETATQLGVDVETMTGILSQFQTRFNGIYDGMKAEADTLMDKMLAGTATEADISSLKKLLDNVEYLSGDAIKRQVEVQNAMAEMLNIDFGSVEKTTEAIQSIKETGLQKMSEIDSYYGELTAQVSVWQEQVRRALELGKISEDEANSYFDIFSSLSATYTESWEGERGQVEAQINTAYNFIKAQLDAKGVEIFEAAEEQNLGFWESIFRPHKDTAAVEKFIEDIYTPVINSLDEAKKEINPEAESVGTETMDNFRMAVEDYESYPGAFRDNALNCVKGFANEILDKKKLATDSVTELFGSVIATSKDKLEEHSPSRVFAEMGEYAVKGFDEGIRNNVENSKTNISSWISDITNVFANWLPSVQETFVQSWNAINATNNTTWNTMKNTIANSVNAIRSNVSQSTINVRTNVLNAWNAIKSNTTSSWNANRTQINNSWNSIRENTIRTANTIKSNILTSWNNIKSITSTTWNSMKSITNVAWNSMKVDVSSSTGNIRNMIQNGMRRAENGWASAWNSMLGKTNGILESIQGAVSSAMNSISEMISAINGALDNLFAKAESASNISVSKGGSTGGSGYKNTKTSSPRMATPEISTAAFQSVNIPAFAGGGITLKHTFAEIGEYNRPEAVLPLTNSKAMGMIAESIFENYNRDNGYVDSPDFGASGIGDLLTETRKQNRLMEQQNRLLERILEKPTLENQDIFNAARSIYKGEATRRYGDSGAFDPVWG